MTDVRGVFVTEKSDIVEGLRAENVRVLQLGELGMGLRLWELTPLEHEIPGVVRV
jgi:hypothetical protein